jgi:hypothetical protein
VKLRERPAANRYAERLDNFEQRLKSADEGGGDPNEVAAVIETVLTESDPSARYPVGMRAKLVGPLRQLIPDGILDRFAGKATS